MLLYSIYILRNKINLKFYVGQTNNLKRRLARHKYEAFSRLNKKPLYQSIRKHGFKNFEMIEIETHAKEFINDAEQFWIEYFQSSRREFGYNLTIGGALHTKSLVIKPKQSSMLGKHHSSKTRQKMSKDRLGSKNAFYGKSHSDKSKKLMSQNTNRKYIGEANPFYGKKFQGNDNPFSKLTEEVVIQSKKLHKEGLTFTELSKKFNVSESAISRAIRGITWSHLLIPDTISIIV